MLLLVYFTVVLVMVNMGNSLERLELRGDPDTGFYVDVSIGTPPVLLRLLVDTGSSNLVVAGPTQTTGRKFNPKQSRTFHNTSKKVAIEYSQGKFSGYMGYDRVLLGSLTLNNVSVAIIETSVNFFSDITDWQGILGIGYDSLLKPSPNGIQSVYTAIQQEYNISDLFSMKLCPARDVFGDTVVPSGGELILGGTDDTHHHGNYMYTPIVKEQFYNVLLSNISIAGTMLPLECSELNRDSTIVDSGTSDIYINEVMFDNIVKILKEKCKEDPDFNVTDSFWSGNEQLAWRIGNNDLYNMFPDIILYFPLYNNQSLQFGVKVPPQLYLRQVAPLHYDSFNLPCGDDCDFFVFGIKSRSTGIILGSDLLTGYDVIYDRKNLRIGFAPTTCELRDNRPSSSQPELIGPEMRDTVDCSYSTSSSTKPGVYGIVLTTAITLSMVLLILILLLYIVHCRHNKRVHHTESMERLRDDFNDDNHSDQSFVISPTEEAGPPTKQSLAYVESKKVKKSTPIAAETRRDTSNSLMVH